MNVYVLLFNDHIVEIFKSIHTAKDSAIENYYISADAEWETSVDGETHTIYDDRGGITRIETYALNGDE